MTIEQLSAAILNEDDQVVRVLADRQRRCVLESLKAATAPVGLADLAVELAHRDSDAAAGASFDETARRMRIRLHHCHLPMLDDAGLIDYDAENQHVSLSDDPRTEATLETAT